MRRPFIAGNWKMNLTRSQARDLAEDLAGRLEDLGDRDLAIFPTFVSLAEAADAASGRRLMVGAQDLWPEANGAFTGELSAEILASAGASIVLVGHSERRHVIGEDDALVARKLHRALGAGLDAILCVGETLEEREAGRTLEVVGRQVRTALDGLDAGPLARVVIAYEPVWAIGTGRTATPDMAQEVHAAIRGLVREIAGDEIADGMRIQYGGSVKPDNVDALMAMPDVDGALVGGASLEADGFERIARFEAKA
ncbi:MAG: triose-phosphate isomerase [Planctomycetota bacterium]